MHTVVAIHCSIRGSSAENHGSGVVSERTSGQLPVIRPNSLTLPFVHRASQIFCCQMKLAACCIWNRKLHTAIGGERAIHTYFKIATRQPNPSPTNYFLDARNAPTSAEPRAIGAHNLEMQQANTQRKTRVSYLSCYSPCWAVFST